MKILVLAFCVCAASAASVPSQYTLNKATQVLPGGSIVSQSAEVKPNYNEQDVNAAIIRSSYENSPDGYNWAFETGNGIAAQATGELKKVDDAEVVVTRGIYSYKSPDGTAVEISYVADETGYHPTGDVLPKGPEIPEAIRRSLEFNANQPAYKEPVKSQ